MGLQFHLSVIFVTLVTSGVVWSQIDQEQDPEVGIDGFVNLVSINGHFEIPAIFDVFGKKVGGKDIIVFFGYMIQSAQAFLTVSYQDLTDRIIYLCINIIRQVFMELLRPFKIVAGESFICMIFGQAEGAEGYEAEQDTQAREP